MLEFSLAQLEAFAAICRLGTFSAAADHLGLTQPAVSLRIRQLEERVDATLFARRGNEVRLTATGELLLGYADRSLELLEEMSGRMRSRNPWDGLVRVGSADLFAASCLPLLLREMESAHPGVGVSLTISNSVSLARKLRDGELDVAFVTNPEPTERVATRMLGHAGLAWFSDGGAGLAATVRPDELRSRRLLVNPAPSALHSAAIDWFGRAAETPPVFSTCNSLPVTVGLVRAGSGVGLIPIPMVSGQPSRGGLVHHREQPRFRPLRLCLGYARGTPMPVVEFLAQTGRRIMRELDFAVGPAGREEAPEPGWP